MGVVNAFMHAPNNPQLDAIKRILWYVKGTMNYEITYTNGNKLGGFYDFDWVGSVDTLQSNTKYCFLFASGAMSWLNKKQLTVALSSIEPPLPR